MKTDLVQWHDESKGLRTGYLVSTSGDWAIVQPIGAVGRKPVKVTVRIKDLKVVK